METVSVRTDFSPDAGRSEAGFRVALLLREINALIGERVAEGLESSGLTLPQITLIKVLAHKKSLGITELAREMNSGKSTVVGIVDRLERAGIVERTRSGEDRREVRVAFSVGASEKVRAARAAVDDCFARAFGGLSDEELGKLESSLGVVLAALGALSDAGTAAEPDSGERGASSGTARGG